MARVEEEIEAEVEIGSATVLKSLRRNTADWDEDEAGKEEEEVRTRPRWWLVLIPMLTGEGVACRDGGARCGQFRARRTRLLP